MKSANEKKVNVKADKAWKEHLKKQGQKRRAASKAARQTRKAQRNR